MWVRDELAGYLHLPKDGTRVEVIGGEIVVSPGPSVDHNGMVGDIERGLFAAELTDPTFVWRSVQTTDLNMFEIGDGYIPDLIVMDAEVLAEARATKAKHLLPYQVDLVVGVTSRSNVVSDRRPDQERKAGTKCRAANVGLWRNRPPAASVRLRDFNGALGPLGRLGC
jgi:hypothetical protein